MDPLAAFLQGDLDLAEEQLQRLRLGGVTTVGLLLSHVSKDELVDEFGFNKFQVMSRRNFRHCRAP